MAFADTAHLIVQMDLKGNAARGLQGINRQIDDLSRKSSVRGGLSQIGRGVGLGLVRGAAIGGVALAGLTTQIVAGVHALQELEDVEAQTRAGLKSTQGVSGQTADSIRRLAEEYEELGGVVDDKVIQAGENVLLTFTNIRKDAFEPALAAALDLSTRMGTDLPSAALQLGKALNDPVRGLTALRRVGVQFSEEQEDQIKRYVELGDTAAAQQIILAEVNKEFGGSFAEAGKTNQATIARFQDSVEELQKNLATAFLPAIDKIARRLNELFSRPEVIQGVKDLGETLAGFLSDENLDKAEDAIKGVFGYLASVPWGAIGSGLQIAGQAAKVAVDAFRSLPPGVQNALITLLAANKLTGGLVASGLGQLVGVALGSLKTITAGHVTVVGPVAGAPTGGAPTAGPLGRAGGALRTVVTNFAALAAIPLTFIAADLLVKGIQDSAAIGQRIRDSIDHADNTTLKGVQERLDIIDATVAAADKNIVTQLFGGDDILRKGFAEERAQLVRTRDDLSRNIVRGTDESSRRLDRVNSTLDLERAAAQAYRSADAARIQSLRDSSGAANAYLQQIRDKPSSFSANVTVNNTVGISMSGIAMNLQRITNTYNTQQWVGQSVQ